MENVRALEGFAVQDGTDFLETQLEDTIEKVLNNHQRQLQRVRVDTDFTSQKYIFKGNPLKLYDVFQNLVENSIEAMAKEDSPILKITTRVVEDRHITVIEDNGCGMSDEIRKHIFEPFYTTRELVKGRQRGLGLFNVWRLIEQHHGTVDLETREGEFTRMKVILPLDKGDNQVSYEAQGD